MKAIITVDICRRCSPAVVAVSGGKIRIAGNGKYKWTRCWCCGRRRFWRVYELVRIAIPKKIGGYVSLTDELLEE